MIAQLNIVRTCRCGCGRQFTPPSSRPGQGYAHGHKPRAASSPAAAKREVHNEAAERQLNYRLALRIAVRDKSRMDAQIEALDDEMGRHREAIAKLQAEKDGLVSRHETAAALAIVLEEAVKHAAEEGAAQ